MSRSSGEKEEEEGRKDVMRRKEVRNRLLNELRQGSLEQKIPISEDDPSIDLCLTRVQFLRFENRLFRLGKVIIRSSTQPREDRIITCVSFTADSCRLRCRGIACQMTQSDCTAARIMHPISAAHPSIFLICSSSKCNN